MIPGEFRYQLNLQESLSSSVVDTIQELEMFVFPFLAGDLLRLSQKALSKDTKKSVLRSALHGLADMHVRDILHNGKLERSGTALAMVLTDC